MNLITQRRLRVGAIAAALLVALATATGCGSSSDSSSSSASTSSSSSSTTADASSTTGLTGTCGQDVSPPPPGDQATLKSFPPEVQKQFTYWPYPVTPTPWTTFKGKKPPWKIGYISQPYLGAGSWVADIPKGFQELAAEGKQNGTISDFQTYVPPDPASATPAQQIAALQRMVKGGMDGIILLPLSADAIAPAVDAAGKQGVPVIGLDTPIPASKSAVSIWSNNGAPTFSETMRIIKGKGNVLIVRGLLGAGPEEIWYKEAVAAAKACPGVKVIGSVKGDWNPATAKTNTLSYIAAHPGQKIDAVLNMGGMAPGIMGAFKQAGKPMPSINASPCTTGQLSYLLDNKATYNQSSTCFSGQQTAYSGLAMMERILDGRGPLSNSIPVSLIGKTINASNVDTIGKPGIPLDTPSEPQGPLDGWANDEYLDQFFKEPGTPSRDK